MIIIIIKRIKSTVFDTEEPVQTLFILTGLDLFRLTSLLSVILQKSDSFSVVMMTHTADHEKGRAWDERVGQAMVMLISPPPPPVVCMCFRIYR